jgi:hypothetical protein
VEVGGSNPLTSTPFVQVSGNFVVDRWYPLLTPDTPYFPLGVARVCTAPTGFCRGGGARGS